MIHTLHPTQDQRWAEFLDRHARASVFHTPAWLEALRQTYGYEPVVYTTTPPGAPLENGLLFCRVRSRLTGRRLVSLPFSDHCEPLVDSQEDLSALLQGLQQIRVEEGLKGIEIRPREDASMGWGEFAKAESFYSHRVDLRPSLEELFRNFQKDSIQRKIRRAQRDGVVCEEGRSESLVGQFYRLTLLTRRRHELPPPPIEWFRNLVHFLGDGLTIRVASKDGAPIAAMILLSFKTTAIYKYGCSDARFHNLGGVPFLFWKTIEDAKRACLHELDLGRSDMDNSGLVRFKDRLGGARSLLCYRKFPSDYSRADAVGWRAGVAKRIFSHLPNRILVVLGKLLYRHIG
jgi:hypothetical protein